MALAWLPAHRREECGAREGRERTAHAVQRLASERVGGCGSDWQLAGRSIQRSAGELEYVRMTTLVM